MIGYVLLISFALVISALVYLWMESYVPREMLDCPDGVSIMIKDVSCVESLGGYNLSFTVKDNGRFDIDGYFINGVEDSATKALVDLSIFIAGGGIDLNPGVGFDPVTLKAGRESSTQIFSDIPDVSAIELTPMREVKINDKQRQAQCGDAKIREEIICG